MKYLFFDVETTGLWRRDLEATDKNQPRIVQIAAQLTDEKEKVHGQLACIVQPDGWKIPKEASDIHKITEEIGWKPEVYHMQILQSYASLHCLIAVQ